MNKQEKIRLLKAVERGEISVDEAFSDKPSVLIQMSPNVFTSNGAIYSKDQVEKFKHTVFIIPDNGRDLVLG